MPSGPALSPGLAVPALKIAVGTRRARMPARPTNVIEMATGAGEEFDLYHYSEADWAALAARDRPDARHFPGLGWLAFKR